MSEAAVFYMIKRKRQQGQSVMNDEEFECWSMIFMRLKAMRSVFSECRRLKGKLF